MLIKCIFKLCLVLSLLLSYFNAVEASEPKSLIFSVNSPGSQPYLYLDPTSKNYVGVVPDLFKELEKKGLFKAVFVDSNQSRSEQFVIAGKVDLYLAHLGWLKQPSKLISSIPIAQHLSFLYSLTPFENDFSLANIANKRVCTHQEFVYIGIEDFFKLKTLVRVDSSGHTRMASMLAKGRCDYAAMNDYKATIIFSAPEFCHFSIYQSPQATSDIELAFVMRPVLHEVKSVIDKQLNAFITSGEITASVLSHSPKPIFPKQASCN
ncbi:MAG: polar amino acid transport system substrate-binding protein [Paraglaciecola sp.]